MVLVEVSPFRVRISPCSPLADSGINASGHSLACVVSTAHTVGVVFSIISSQVDGENVVRLKEHPMYSL
jgi:hypothetical protein